LQAIITSFQKKASAPLFIGKTFFGKKVLSHALFRKTFPHMFRYSREIFGKKALFDSLLDKLVKKLETE
jgi:hypothetical protein